MNRIPPCWAPVGTRPEVAAQLVREYIDAKAALENVATPQAEAKDRVERIMRGKQYVGYSVPQQRRGYLG
jgi:hypothetical protein